VIPFMPNVARNFSFEIRFLINILRRLVARKKGLNIFGQVASPQR